MSFYTKLERSKNDKEFIEILISLRSPEFFNDFIKSLDATKVKPDQIRSSLRVMFPLLLGLPNPTASSHNTEENETVASALLSLGVTESKQLANAFLRLVTEQKFTETDGVGAVRTLLLTVHTYRVLLSKRVVVATDGVSIPTLEAIHLGASSCLQRLLASKTVYGKTAPKVSALVSPNGGGGAAVTFMDSLGHPIYDVCGNYWKDPNKAKMPHTLLTKADDPSPQLLNQIVFASTQLQHPKTSSQLSADYLIATLEAVKAYGAMPKHPLCGTNTKGHSIALIEAVAVNTIRCMTSLASKDPVVYRGLLLGEVLSFYITVVFESRMGPVRDVDQPRAFLHKPSGQLIHDDRSGYVPEFSELLLGHTPVGIPYSTDIPHYSHDVMIACMEFFLHHCESGEDVQHHWSTWVQCELWHKHLMHPHFPVSLLYFFYSNAEVIAKRTTLFQLAEPLLFQVFALNPHESFMIFQHLLPRLITPDTYPDVFLRVLYLPLLSQVFDIPNLTPNLSNVDSLLPKNDFVRMCVKNLFDTTVFSSTGGGGGGGADDDMYTPRTHFESFFTNHFRDFDNWMTLLDEIIVAEDGLMGVKAEIAATFVVPLLTTYFHVLLRDTTKAEHVIRLIPHILYCYHYLFTQTDAKYDLQNALLHHLQDIIVKFPVIVHMYVDDIVEALHQHYVPGEENRCRRLRTCAANVMSFGVLSSPTEVAKWKPNHLTFFDVLHDITWESVASLSMELVSLPMDGSSGCVNDVFSPEEDNEDVSLNSCFVKVMNEKVNEVNTTDVVCSHVSSSFVQTIRFLNATIFTLAVITSYLPELHDRCVLSLINVTRALSKYPAHCSNLAKTAAMLTQVLRAPSIAKGSLQDILRDQHQTTPLSLRAINVVALEK